MGLPKINNCPGTLVESHETYSRTCLQRMFGGKKVNHILPYLSPTTKEETTEALYLQNHTRASISGVQEKFSLVLRKNKLGLIEEGEKGNYILKPIPNIGKNQDQMPANEHLTMQLARQVFGIETAENVLIFFKDGEPAYLTKRFDYDKEGNKLAKEDFASLAGRTAQTHGEHYKYLGNYLELFTLLKKYTPAYQLEAIKIFKQILFNYLFSNGDAHLKNFSLLETPLGDFRLSPAYDLLNTRLHIEDSDFALEDGLLPRTLHKGGIKNHFTLLAEKAAINSTQVKRVFESFLTEDSEVEHLIGSSFLNDRSKRNYLQSFQGRINKLKR